jgi:hypothetical protein
MYLAAPRRGVYTILIADEEWSFSARRRALRSDGVVFLIFLDEPTLGGLR